MYCAVISVFIFVQGMIALCEMVEFYECASRINFAGSSKLKPRAWFCLGKMLKKVTLIVLTVCIISRVHYYELLITIFSTFYSSYSVGRIASHLMVCNRQYAYRINSNGLVN